MVNCNVNESESEGKVFNFKQEQELYQRFGSFLLREFSHHDKIILKWTCHLHKGVHHLSHRGGFLGLLQMFTGLQRKLHFVDYRPNEGRTAQDYSLFFSPKKCLTSYEGYRTRTWKVSASKFAEGSRAPRKAKNLPQAEVYSS